ncbi:MAG: fumarylacetoacetate hydrolase family protein [Gammaproteobacteria bacterium]
MKTAADQRDKAAVGHEHRPGAGRIFCIGRNYVRHARELDNPLPRGPVVFMKPHSCLVVPGEPIHFPRHGRELHHETELVVRIGRAGSVTEPERAPDFVDAVTLGLDLTLRDVQQDLKRQGLPWEAAKAFEQSAPIGTFVACDASVDLQEFAFHCTVNDEPRQAGNTRDMIFPVDRLLVELSRIWTLRAGDLIYTGTPEGVGPLHVGDSIEIASDLTGAFRWTVVD